MRRMAGHGTRLLRGGSTPHYCVGVQELVGSLRLLPEAQHIQRMRGMISGGPWPQACH